MLKRLAAPALAVLLLSSSALAGEAGDIATEALYGGDLAGGQTRLEPLVTAGDQEAMFGAGFITFVQGIEGFAQALYRHGLAAPETGPLGPPLAVPVPVNADPEPLDYAKVRAILDALVVSMDDARAQLEQAGQLGEYVVPIDILKVRIDVNNDGTAEDGETIERVFAQAFGLQRPNASPAPTPVPEDSTRKGRGDKTSSNPQPETPAASNDTSIGFDRADAIWLAGYSQVIAAQADFFLAHDFEEFVNVSFHRLFPAAQLPMQNYAEGGTLVLDPTTDTAIADVVAAIHTIDWPVMEPDRLKRVLERFQAITALSRANWEAILAETDDNRELLPSPRQTPMMPGSQVTDEIVAAWHETLDTADQILAGELLVPHWRFRQGFDLKAYFETATQFDLVMLLTGSDALPYLKDGPVASAESFAAANRVFGDEWLGYVFWFN